MKRRLLKELPLYSNLVIANFNEKNYSEAISLASIALSIYGQIQESERPASLYEKIVFNYMRAMCAQALILQEARKTEDARLLNDQVVHLMETHKDDLSEQNQATIRTVIEEFRSKFPRTPDVTSEAPLASLSTDDETNPLTLKPSKIARTKVDSSVAGSSKKASVGDMGMFKPRKPSSFHRKSPPPEQCCSIM